MKKWSLFLLTFGCFQAVFSQSETVERKPITIMVFDRDEKGVAEAKITLMQPDSVYARGVTSLAGQVVFENVPTGDYDVLIELQNGKNILFNNQWIETKDANDRIYRIPTELKGKDKPKEKGKKK